MKRLLMTLSLAVNVLVILAALAVWYGVATNVFVRMFLEPIHERWVTQFAALPVMSEDVVFLGDSITEGGAWNELFPDVQVRNRGISGDVTAGVLARLDQVSAGRPQKVFLLIGTNDLSNDVPVENIVSNIVEITARIHRDSPDTQVYVQSILPRSAEYREGVEQLNHELEAAIRGRATWVNLYPAFLDSTDGSIRNDLSNDELHLLGEGYLVWRDEILRIGTDQPAVQ